jgi:outer membrane receptor protein involved in Fe transport
MRSVSSITLFLLATSAFAQQQARVCITDAAHHPISHVTIDRGPQGVTGTAVSQVLAATGADGCATFLPENGPGIWPQILYLSLEGFASATIPEPAAGSTVTVILRPDPVQQSVTVTADRGLAGINTSTSVATLSQQQMQQAPGLALDDRLHQVAGSTLFRRTASWSANPTTEGVSLRGLGSTAASRTLVVSDQVPFNDPFGGWVHWDEVPTLAIASVSLLRGGSSDLYGSSAIGGVIDLVPVLPSPLQSTQDFDGDDTGAYRPGARAPQAPNVYRLAATGTGATQNSALEDALLTAETRYGLGLAAISGFTTGGYIPTATAVRGPVDIPANVTGESGRIELRTPTYGQGTTAFLRGNLLNEARSNGTPDQTNATRLWRYQGGADYVGSRTTALLRLFGSREDYRQSFSSINATRTGETLTKLQRVPTDELGFAAQTARQVFGITAALGLDAHDVRATDNETGVSNNVPGTNVSTSARQREIGGFTDALWSRRGTAISGSIRVDSFRTFSARQISSTGPAVTPLPEIDELFASPHLGLTQNLGHGFELVANGFRAFRGPTMNELYRTGQVGSQTTLANNSLLAERATGFEFGASLPVVQRYASVHASYFWTEVNRPISAILLSQTATTQTLQRENLGQIRSRGLMLEARSRQWHQLDASVSYQLAIATVTAYSPTGLAAAQPSILGNWIPQVPRECVTSTVNYAAQSHDHSLANLHVIASYTGRQFDDAANQYVLHPYARFDVSADRTLPHGISLFAGAQNLLNRSIDAGRTPILTLAAPRLVQAGLRYTFTR